MTVKELETKILTFSKKLDSSNDSLRAEIEELRSLFTKKFENLTAKLELTESTVAVQQTVIENLKTQISSLREKGEEKQQDLSVKIERQEQYHRRCNLRINGVSAPAKGEAESNEQVMAIVDEVCNDLGVVVKRNDIFRAHRIGQRKTDSDTGRRHQAIIVRFRSWNARCAVYRARPTGKRPRKPKPGETTPPGGGFKSVSLDLTHHSYALLDTARELISAKFPDNKDSEGKDKVFCYSDVNCNLAVRFGENDCKFFSSKSQLDEIFGGLQN